MCYQVSDQLIINDENIAIAPLPIVASGDIAHTPTLSFASTAHVRGYIATWTLIDDKLYLANVEGCYQLQSTTPIFADWINETILPGEGTYDVNINMPIENGLMVAV